MNWLLYIWHNIFMYPRNVLPKTSYVTNQTETHWLTVLYAFLQSIYSNLMKFHTHIFGPIQMHRPCLHVMEICSFWFKNERWHDSRHSHAHTKTWQKKNWQSAHFMHKWYRTVYNTLNTGHTFAMYAFDYVAFA